MPPTTGGGARRSSFGGAEGRIRGPRTEKGSRGSLPYTRCVFSPRLEELLDLLIDLPPGERSARLEQLCPDDPVLRGEVRSLLGAYEDSASFLRPVLRSGPRPSDQLGRYRVIAEIGRGAMGVVCLAHDAELGRNVALKTLTSEVLGSKARRARLREEARMLAAVSQPNIAQVYSFEEVAPTGDDGGPGSGERPPVAFLTMEFVPGVTLAEMIRTGPLPLGTALEVGRQIAAALEAAHAQGLVHRDLKPQNVRVTPDGWVKVLDFGLAFSPESAPDAARRFCGTPGYMSPEQAGGGEVGPATDLWSFGCVLGECLAGVGDAGTALGPHDPTERAGSRVATLSSLLTRLLADDPALRPTATEARRALEEEVLRHRALALFAPTVVRTEESTARSGEAGGERAGDTAAQGQGGAASEGSTRRSHLPRRLSEFLGREDLLAEVDQLLGRHRLVTLTGTGGAGKTRLALEVASRAADRHRGGAFFVDLSTIESGAHVGAVAAHALGVRDTREESGTASLAAAAARALGDVPALVLLDNCEHVLAEAAAWVLTLLEHGAAVTVLATSRAPLGVAGEQVLPIPPLALPVDLHDLAACRRSEAVRLFEARARSRQPSFHLRDEQVPVVVEICRRADGLPLAIEIAAGHARALPADEILARLAANPLSLVAPHAGRTGRHRSLAGVVRWSYRLLGRAERLLFERLSAFRGAFTLASAEAVCARDGLSAWQLCDLLARLVERSLVEVETLEEGGLARYRLLETIQRFARERLERRPGEPEATERRLVSHAAELLVVRAGEEGQGLLWMSRIDREVANLTEALETALRRGWAGEALEIAGAMGRYWSMAGYWREGLSFFSRTFALVASVPDAADSETSAVSGAPAAALDPVRAARRARAHQGASRLHAMLEQRAAAAAEAEEALRWADLSGNQRVRAGARNDRGLAHWFAVEVEDAERCFREALALYTEIGDRSGIANIVGNLSAVHGYRGEHAEALAGFQRQHELSQELGDRLGSAKALLSVGRSLILLGRAEEALGPLLEAQEVHREIRDVPGTALALHNLGDTYRALGRLCEARECLLESARLRHELGNRQGVCSVLLGFAALFEKAGDAEAVGVVLGGVARAFGELGGEAPPARPQILAHLEAIARTALGAEAAEAARAFGATLNLVALRDWVAGRQIS